MPYFIDTPRSGRIEGPLPIVAGWFATTEPVPLESAALHAPSGILPFQTVPRPDVHAAFPGHAVLGFSAFIGLEHLAQDTLDLCLEVDARPLATFSLQVGPETREQLQRIDGVRKAKRGWCLSHSRCPVCHSPDLGSGMTPSEIRCQSCKTLFPQDTKALNFLTAELYRASALCETTNISSNHYDHLAAEIIDEAQQSGQKVLDCGAGFRPNASENVVTLEIVDYPSTDVLGVGQSLPFQDNVFAGVLSFAVLEHVSDPFACARELMRVVKPGGRIYAHVPFLQPEHGYPNHFYNMTRQGLANLFRGFDIEGHFVPISGVPIWSLHWIAQQYAAHLPEATRQRFLSMTMGELLAKNPMDYATTELVTDMDELGNWILACTTALIVRKPLAAGDA